MSKKRNKKSAIVLAVTVLLGIVLLSGCGFNIGNAPDGGGSVVSEQPVSSPFSQKESSDDSSDVSNTAASTGAEQDGLLPLCILSPLYSK